MVLEFGDDRVPATEKEMATLRKVVPNAPPEWFDFYSKRNGAYPEGYFVNKRELGVDFFPDVEGILDLKRSYSDHDRVPRWSFLFASDPGGNLWLLSVRESDYGSVWYWDHDWEAEDGDPPTEENIERFAGSFNEFLDDLEYEPFNSES